MEQSNENIRPLQRDVYQQELKDMFSINKTCQKTCFKLIHVMNFITDILGADWNVMNMWDAKHNHTMADAKTKIRIDSIHEIISDIDDPIARAKVELAHPDIDVYYTSDGHKCADLYEIYKHWDNYELVHEKNLAGLFESDSDFYHVFEFAIKVLGDNNQIYVDYGCEEIEGIGLLSDIDNVIE